MDFLLLAIVFGITAIALGVAIYFIMIRLFKTGTTNRFIFALLMLIISDFMVIFLFVLCIYKLNTGS